MRKFALALLTVLAAAVPVAAQAPSPFDMSGERGGVAPGGPATPPMTVPATPDARQYVPPMELQPPPAGGVPIRPPAPQPPPMPAPIAPAPAAEAPPAVPVTPSSAGAGPDGRFVRYIVPRRALRFEGEVDQKAWSVFLTAGQAARTARLTLSYRNAIVVMPEASRLRVSLNGRPVAEIPLASSERFRSVTADIPPGLLQAGGNVLRFEAYQRHRTDCSIQSTYELWTEVDPAQTVLEFAAGDTPDMLQSLEDLPAVGYGRDGVTSIHMVAPGIANPAESQRLLRLIQALALAGGYPNPSVVVSERLAAADTPGTLTVLVGVGNDVAPLLAGQGPRDFNQPSVSFVDAPAIGPNVLAVTGASTGQVDAAIDAIVQRVDRPLGRARSTLNTASWLSPDVHYFMRAETVSLAKLGVATQQFSGRRFRAEFAIGIPPDFYAEAYGEAQILLDAAYTSAVLPASHIDVYVNGQIAATTRVVNRTGGIFRHLPIQIPFRHLHPGVNRIVIEAALNTAADSVCAPGGAVAGPDRFVLFDTTEFAMPAFARIAQRPNLSAFAGTGFPYSIVTTPSALVLARTDATTLSAAGTLLGRLAIQAGRIVQLSPTPIANVGEQPAIFVGAASQFPDGTLSRFSIAESVLGTWKSEQIRPLPGISGGSERDPNSVAPSDIASEATEEVFDRWREDLSGGGGWRGQVSSFEEWLQRNFDISFAALRIGPTEQVAFEPPARTSLLLAQVVPTPTGGTWTLVTAPSAEQLVESTQSVAAIETWSQIGGQFSAYSAATGRLDNQAATGAEFVITQPLTLQNIRLIAANWFSSNIVFYAIGLIGLCIFLGIITSGLLWRLGRPS